MHATPATSSWHPGALVGERYQVLRRLSGGGMGEVYEGRDVKRDLAVALKRVVVELAGDTLERERRLHEAATRLHREAIHTSRLGHPGIVNVFDLVYDDDGAPVMVMELLHGITLHDHLTYSTLPVAVAIDWMAQVLDALAVAHAAGVVHRDLKPANLFLVEDAAMPHGVRVKIFDFGVAKHVGDDNSSTQSGDDTDEDQNTALTMANVFLGSYQYASPEQFDPSRVVSARSDLYAVGVILFRALVGRHPAGTRTLHDLMMRTLFGNIERSARPYRPEVPPRLDAALGRALALKPEDRFRSAASMREALLESQREYSAAAPPPTPLFSGPPSQPVVASQPAPPPPPSPVPAAPSQPVLAQLPPAPSRPWVSVSLAVVAALGWIAWALTRFGR